MIKYIIFDYGGVLGSNAHEWKTTFKDVLKETGLTADEMGSIFSKHWPRLKVGKETMLHFWKNVARISKKQISPEKIQSIYNKGHIINQKVLSLTKSLKEKYRLVILMNASDDEARSKVERFKLDRIFGNIYSSYEQGIAKPDKRIFERVLKDLKTTPEETLFIDNQRGNIQSARSVGIKSILFKNLKQLKNELNRIIISSP